MKNSIFKGELLLKQTQGRLGECVHGNHVPPTCLWLDWSVAWKRPSWSSFSSVLWPEFPGCCQQCFFLLFLLMFCFPRMLHEVIVISSTTQSSSLGQFCLRRAWGCSFRNHCSAVVSLLLLISQWHFSSKFNFTSPIIKEFSWQCCHLSANHARPTSLSGQIFNSSFSSISNNVKVSERARQDCTCYLLYWLTNKTVVNWRTIVK